MAIRERIDPTISAQSSPSTRPRRRSAGSVYGGGFGGGYSAGYTSNATYGWTQAPITPDQLIQRQLTTLVARSRDQVASNDYMKRFIGMVLNNVIGPEGPILRPKIMRKRPQAGRPVTDERARLAMVNWWKSYTRKKSCDFMHELPMRELYRLILRTVAVDGEVFIEDVFEGPWGYQIQLIDPTRVDITYSDTHLKFTKNNQRIRFGIEYDAHWRPTAYYIRDEAGEIKENGARLRRIPASRITHLYIKERISQRRGIPWTATPLEKTMMLEGFEEAAVTRARASAANGGWYETEDAEGWQGDEIDPVTGEGVLHAEANTFREMPKGFKLHQSESPWPGDYLDFAKGILRSISAGLNIGYPNFAQDYESINFAAGKLSTYDERDNWMLLQRWFDDCFATDHFEKALKEALLVGIPVNAGFMRAADFERYSECDFQWRRWRGVEPAAEAKAAQQSIDARTRSLSSIIREQGDDPNDVFDEIAAEHALLAELGVEIISSKPGTTEGKTNGEAEEETDESDDSAEADNESGSGAGDSQTP